MQMQRFSDQKRVRRPNKPIIFSYMCHVFKYGVVIQISTTRSCTQGHTNTRERAVRHGYTRIYSNILICKMYINTRPFNLVCQLNGILNSRTCIDAHANKHTGKYLFRKHVQACVHPRTNIHNNHHTNANKVVCRFYLPGY